MVSTPEMEDGGGKIQKKNADFICNNHETDFS
jgi:hypothetical protein